MSFFCPSCKNESEECHHDIELSTEAAAEGETKPGRKDDQGKPDLEPFFSPLLANAHFAPAVASVVRVLEAGAARYGADNWVEVEPADRYRKALLRHVVEDGAEDTDSGEPALAHAICCALMLLAKRLGK